MILSTVGNDNLGMVDNQIVRHNGNSQSIILSHCRLPRLDDRPLFAVGRKCPAGEVVLHVTHQPRVGGYMFLTGEFFYGRAVRNLGRIQSYQIFLEQCRGQSELSPVVLNWTYGYIASIALWSGAFRTQICSWAGN